MPAKDRLCGATALAVPIEPHAEASGATPAGHAETADWGPTASSATTAGLGVQGPDLLSPPASGFNALLAAPAVTVVDFLEDEDAAKSLRDVEGAPPRVGIRQILHELAFLRRRLGPADCLGMGARGQHVHEADLVRPKAEAGIGLRQAREPGTAHDEHAVLQRRLPALYPGKRRQLLVMKVVLLGRHGEDAGPDGKPAMAPDGGRRGGVEPGAAEAVDGGAASFLSGSAALQRFFRGGLGSLGASLVCAGKTGPAEGKDKQRKQAYAAGRMAFPPPVPSTATVPA